MFRVLLTFLSIFTTLFLGQPTIRVDDMAIGERIHFFRTLWGMTQKYLGTQVGFPEKTADACLAQYETGTRTLKADMTTALANILDVSPLALSVPDIDSYMGLMHTLLPWRTDTVWKSARVMGKCICVSTFATARMLPS